MKRMLCAMLLSMLGAVPAMANCAMEKKGEFDALLEELRRHDEEYAHEARRAFGVVSGYEAFSKDEPRCSHMDRLLDDMRVVLEGLKSE